MATTSPSSGAPALITTDGHVYFWEDLVREYRPAIEAYARSRGIPEAADVAQDVFADVVDRLVTFEGGRAELRSFLFTIAHRRIADRHRRAYRRPGIDPGNAATDATPEEECIAMDDVAAVMGALKQLDERSRKVLVLRFIDERNTAEIAAAMRVSVTNVRAIQSRALRRVRGILEKSRHIPGRRAMALLVMSLLDRFRRRDATAEPSAVATAGQPTVVAAASTATTATTTVACAATGAPLMNIVTVAVFAAAAAVGTGTAIAAADDPEHSRPIEAAVSTGATLDVAASQRTSARADLDAGAELDAGAGLDADVAVDADVQGSIEADLSDDVTVDVTVPEVAVDTTLAAEADIDVDAAVDVAAHVGPQIRATANADADAGADATVDVTVDGPAEADVNADVNADVSAAVNGSVNVTVPPVTVPPVTVPPVTVPPVTVPAVTLPEVTVPTVTLPTLPTLPSVGADVAAAAQAGAGVASGVASGVAAIAANGASSIGLGG